MLKLGILSLEHPHSRGNHIPALKYMKDRVQVAAIYDPDEEFAKPWVEMFGAKYYASRDELLADPAVEAVLVTSVNDCHADDSIAAIKAGKTVFCDKPIATSVADGVRIAQAVEEYNGTFLTTFPVRFNKAVLRAKKAIDEGKIGKVQAVMATNHGCMYEPGAPEWVLDPARNGGGCIIDHTVHVADLIRWFTGEEFVTVQAEARKSAVHTYIKAEDIAVMQGKMSGGTVFQIDACWSRRPEVPTWGDVTMRIVGTKGSISLDVYNNQRIEMYVGDEIQLHYPNQVAKDHGDIFDDLILHNEKGTPLVGANHIDGLRTIELAYAAYDSVREGKEVAVKQNMA